MDAARWIIAFVAAVTAIGGLCADWLIPFGARQHLKNPAWPPHAKFHNAPGDLHGVGARGAGDRPPVRCPQNLPTLLLAALIASLYWDALIVAPFLPGTAWVDPEFAAVTPRPLGLYPQQLIGYVLLALIVVAAVLAISGH